MAIGAVILIAVTAVTLLTYGFWRMMKPTKKPEHPENYEPMRCGTPYLRNGGTLIAQTENIIEIITRDGTETMTVDEYNARKEKR